MSSWGDRVRVLSRGFKNGVLLCEENRRSGKVAESGLVLNKLLVSCHALRRLHCFE